MRVELRDIAPSFVPSVYFSTAYGQANAEHLGCEWRTIADADGLWQIPLLLRRDFPDCIDAQTPYGYGGIFAAESLSDEHVQSGWGESVDILLALNVNSVFFRFAPFQGIVDERIRRAAHQLKIEEVWDTVSVPLTSKTALWQGMQGRARTAVRKAESLGMTTSVKPCTDVDVSSNSAFRKLYDETMDRVNAAPEYRFSDPYFERISSLDAFVVEVTLASGEPAASALILSDEKVGHYHLSGSTPAAARGGANALLIWALLNWACDQGFELVHLGGGLTSGDNLFKFKSSFGGTRTPFEIGKAILDEPQYADLVSRSARSQGYSTAQLASSQYFPAYRAKVEPIVS